MSLVARVQGQVRYFFWFVGIDRRVRRIGALRYGRCERCRVPDGAPVRLGASPVTAQLTGVLEPLQSRQPEARGLRRLRSRATPSPSGSLCAFGAAHETRVPSVG